MPRIVDRFFFNGAEFRLERLGLERGLAEVEAILQSFQLHIEERRDANGASAIRKVIDTGFDDVGGWITKKSGGIDWTKCWSIDGARVCLGVEIQVSSRSDLMIVDIAHLREAIESGLVDVGVLVVPSPKMATFLTDRVGSFHDAVKAVERARAQHVPLAVLSIEHDGPGSAHPKQPRRPRRVGEVTVVDAI